MDNNNLNTAKRYSDEELEEFRVIINEKLAQATQEYQQLRAQLDGDKTHDGEDTVRQFNDMIDESSNNFQRSELQQLMNRQLQFIEKLRAELQRIYNKTYVICRVTGELIPKERLRAVPHATLSIKAKNM
jgi:RNA polymerase-binding transcription factor DksA